MADRDPTAFDAKAHWDVIVALGELVLAGKKARDLMMIAWGDTLPAASLHILYETANGILHEQGAAFAAHRDDPGAGGDFVRLALDRLHGSSRPQTVPADDAEREGAP